MIDQSAGEGYTVSLDLEAVFAPVDRCPACSMRALTLLPSDAVTILECASCRAQWLLRLGELWKLDSTPASGPALEPRD